MLGEPRGLGWLWPCCLPRPEDGNAWGWLRWLGCPSISIRCEGTWAPGQGRPRVAVSRWAGQGVPGDRLPQPVVIPRHAAPPAPGLRVRNSRLRIVKPWRAGPGLSCVVGSLPWRGPATPLWLLSTVPALHPLLPPLGASPAAPTAPSARSLLCPGKAEGVPGEAPAPERESRGPWRSEPRPAWGRRPSGGHRGPSRPRDPAPTAAFCGG